MPQIYACGEKGQSEMTCGIVEEELTDHYFHDLGSCIMLNDDYWSLDDIIETLEE